MALQTDVEYMVMGSTELLVAGLGDGTVLKDREELYKDHSVLEKLKKQSVKQIATRVVEGEERRLRCFWKEAVLDANLHSQCQQGIDPVETVVSL